MNAHGMLIEKNTWTIWWARVYRHIGNMVGRALNGAEN